MDQLDLLDDEPQTSTGEVTTGDIRRGLERRYRDGYVVLHEVSNHLGRLPRVSKHWPEEMNKRYLDTVVVGLYRSTEYRVIGHEIKRTRADWLSELRQPKKAEAFARLVHGFYLVTPPGIVQDGELPDGWGHLLYYPSRMREVVRPFRPSPVFDLSPSWVAALIARAVSPKRLSDTD